MVRTIKFRAFVDRDIIEREPARIYPVIEYKWGIDRNQDRATLLMPNDIKWYTLETKWCLVMQYTGLKDKNGKEIYEGDIFKNPITPWSDEEIVEVYWREENLEWAGRSKDSDDELVAFDIDKGEVIGNIYENPELLVGTKEKS